MPELIALFRTFADVVLPEDLIQYVKVLALSTGVRQIRTSKPSAAFKRYQMVLDARIKAIEERDRPAEPGDDILLSVITDGRHAAIDLRLVDPDNDNEPDNKLNDLIANAYRIWRETADSAYVRADAKPFELPGAAQMIFSDLGTISVEKSRGSAYATEGSMDAQMWQNNEHKARFIAAALSGDTSIRRLEDLGEGQANPFAMAKAIASGDTRLMQKAGLEADIARLERLRAAHQDDQFAVRRQIREAERDIEYSTRRIGEIGQDIEKLVPTTGDAFRMQIGDEIFVERKLAGRALMKEILTLVQLQQEGDIPIASLGGFDLAYAGERFGRDGYRYTIMLMRTGADYEIELPVTTTPLGAIARLEHALVGFEEEQERYRQRLADAKRRHASYQSRQGGGFGFAGELAEKRHQLAEIEKALATGDFVGLRDVIAA